MSSSLFSSTIFSSLLDADTDDDVDVDVKAGDFSLGLSANCHDGKTGVTCGRLGNWFRLNSRLLMLCISVRSPLATGSSLIVDDCCCLSNASCLSMLLIDSTDSFRLFSELFTSLIESMRFSFSLSVFGHFDCNRAVFLNRNFFIFKKKQQQFKFLFQQKALPTIYLIPLRLVCTPWTLDNRLEWNFESTWPTLAKCSIGELFSYLCWPPPVVDFARLTVYYSPIPV